MIHLKLCISFWCTLLWKGIQILSSFLFCNKSFNCKSFLKKYPPPPTQISATSNHILQYAYISKLKLIGVMCRDLDTTKTIRNKQQNGDIHEMWCLCRIAHISRKRSIWHRYHYCLVHIYTFISIFFITFVILFSIFSHAL